MGMLLYKDRARQLIDFSSLSWGKVHPTDIDGVMEFNGKKLVLMELKEEGRRVDMGQRLTLEHIADNWKSTEGNDAIVIYSEHNIYNTDEDVDIGETMVKEVYWNKKRYNYEDQNRTVRSVVWAFAHEEIQKKLEREECLPLRP